MPLLQQQADFLMKLQKCPLSIRELESTSPLRWPYARPKKIVKQSGTNARANSAIPRKSVWHSENDVKNRQSDASKGDCAKRSKVPGLPLLWHGILSFGLQKRHERGVSAFAGKRGKRERMREIRFFSKKEVPRRFLHFPSGAFHRIEWR